MIDSVKSTAPQEYPALLVDSRRYRGRYLIPIGLAALALVWLLTTLDLINGLAISVAAAMSTIPFGWGAGNWLRHYEYIKRLRNARWVVNIITHQAHRIYRLTIDGLPDVQRVNDIRHEFERRPVTAKFPKARYRRGQRELGMTVVLCGELEEEWPDNLPYAAPVLD
jgi:hypothetical protein